MKNILKHLFSIVIHKRKLNKKIKEYKNDDLVYVMNMFKDYYDKYTVYDDVKVCHIKNFQLFEKATSVKGLFSLFTENENGKLETYILTVRVNKEHLNKNYLTQTEGIHTILITTSLEILTDFVQKTYKREVNYIIKQTKKAFFNARNQQELHLTLFTQNTPKTSLEMVRKQRKKVMTLIRKLPTVL